MRVATADEAISIAEQKAQDLHIPWSREDVSARWIRLWPFPGNWKVVARVKSHGAIVTMWVAARNGYAQPKRVLYPAGGLV
jgi:hypothetical protein